MNIDFDRLLGYLDELVEYRQDEDVDTTNLESFIKDIEALETSSKQPVRAKSPKKKMVKVEKDRPIKMRTRPGAIAR